MSEQLRPSYGGVVLRRHGRQVIAATGEEVIRLLRDETVIAGRWDEMCPDLRGARRIGGISDDLRQHSTWRPR